MTMDYLSQQDVLEETRAVEKTALASAVSLEMKAERGDLTDRDLHDFGMSVDLDSEEIKDSWAEGLLETLPARDKRVLVAYLIEKFGEMEIHVVPTDYARESARLRQKIENRTLSAELRERHR